MPLLMLCPLCMRGSELSLVLKVDFWYTIWLSIDDLIWYAYGPGGETEELERLEI